MKTPDISKIKPLFDYVLIKPLAEAESATPSGIIIPDTAKDKPQIGEVIAVGPGQRDPKGKIIPTTIKPGQKVIFRKWGGNDVKYGSEEWMVIKEQDLLAVIK